jgi:histone-lysine N-methyltransferase SETMAR
LTDDQKQNRVNVSKELLDQANDANSLKNIITGDETWVYGYDVGMKVQSSQWVSKTSPRPKKACQVHSHIKVMLKVYFDSESVVHYEFLPQGRTVNKEYYLEVIQRLREAVRKKRPDAWQENRWMLQHDNAPSHSSFLARDFLAKHMTTVLPQPPYSPDLAPADFFLFPKLKSTLKGRCFESTEVIKTNLLAHLRSIPKTAFQECFRTLKKRWQRCIQSRGEYFEGDNTE